MKHTYIGITVGPIGQTMSLVTKPAALWASSYLFSYISKSLCEGLCELVNPEAIITPYIPRDEQERAELFAMTDGVGLFHDHIIFRTDRPDGTCVTLEQVGALREQVIHKAAEVFTIDEEYLKSYLLIAACCVETEEGENPIIACEHQLNSMELQQPFVYREQKNALLSAFSNERLYQVAHYLNLNQDRWQLTENGKIRDIPTLAKSANSPGFKKNGHYCILRADGDNMSKIIARLTGDDTDEVCRHFSRRCLAYCSALSKEIGAYGGMTVYAGGDDLLALVPCEGPVLGQKSTVFSLVKRIDEIFAEYFLEYGRLRSPGEVFSLSFGMYICDAHFPLYEALELSAGMLFGIAKQNNTKNCVAVQLRKGTGQSVELLLNKKRMEETGECAFASFVEILESLSRATADGTADGFLLSASQKLLVFESLFEAAREHDPENLFRNIFDADFHLEASRSGFLHGVLPEYYSKWCLSRKIVALDKQRKLDSVVWAMVSALRMMKFFVERGED